MGQVVAEGAAEVAMMPADSRDKGRPSGVSKIDLTAVWGRVGGPAIAGGAGCFRICPLCGCCSKINIFHVEFLRHQVGRLIVISGNQQGRPGAAPRRTRTRRTLMLLQRLLLRWFTGQLQGSLRLAASLRPIPWQRCTLGAACFPS